MYGTMYVAFSLIAIPEQQCYGCKHQGNFVNLFVLTYDLGYHGLMNQNYVHNFLKLMTQPEN